LKSLFLKTFLIPPVRFKKYVGFYSIESSVDNPSNRLQKEKIDAKNGIQITAKSFSLIHVFNGV
jgi:hypothetical protein